MWCTYETPESDYFDGVKHARYVIALSMAALIALGGAAGLVRGAKSQMTGVERIEEVAVLVPSLGLNIALIDGFGAKTLKWATVERLARFQRMDLLIHFPTNTIKRNLANPTAPGFEFVVDELVGSAEWRARVRRPRDVVELIDLRNRCTGRCLRWG